MRQYQVTVGRAIAVPILTANDEGVTAIIRADPANTAPIYLGNAKVTPAGVGLKPGRAQTLYLEGGEDLYGISSAADQLVAILSAPGLSHFGLFDEGLVEGRGAHGAPVGGVLTVQGATPGSAGFPVGLVEPSMGDAQASDLLRFLSANGINYSPAVMGFIFNGTKWDRARTPAIFKPLSAVLITAETTIWTPAAGKKFRLMGYAITQGAATGAVTLRDNTAGTTILVIPPNTVGVVQLSPAMGNGILSAAANNVLTATGVATETITGYVFGTEE